MHRRPVPVLRLLAVSLVAAVALTGCLPFLSDAEPGPGRTATGESVADELRPFYQQPIDWSDCGERLQCAEVEAPLDWADASSGDTIDLAIVRHRAAGAGLGSLLVNPGGPGGSGFDFVQQSAPFVVSPAVLEAYDVVGFDPRGVGRSTPVTCLDDAEKDELLYGTFEADYGTEAWLDELAAEQGRFAEACSAETGELLGHVDTGSVARDLDMLRAVLGDEKLSYLGYSYGTEIGATYAELFPEKVGRLVLDGAVDPMLGDVEKLTVQMAGFESATRAYLEACLAAADCPFAGSLDSALSELRDLLDSVDALELEGRDGRVLDQATVGTALAYTLYSQASWPQLSALVDGIRAGDPEPAFRNADGYNDRAPSGGYGSNSFEVYTAVTCLDGDFAQDAASTLERLAEIEAAAPTVGRAIALDDFAVLDTVCSEWPEPRPELPETYDAEGAAPILVVGTTNDPATPYAWARSLAAQLSSGVLVSYEGEGHTIYAQGVPCVDETVDAYLLEGVVPEADPRC